MYVHISFRYRADYEISEEDGVFDINEKNEVSVNASCCKGVISLVGKGGAIRVQRGSVFISNWYVRFPRYMYTVFNGI